jgi:pyrroline-5-carboxylate reductase
MGGSLITSFVNYLESKRELLNLALDKNSIKNIFYLCDTNPILINEYRSIGFKNTSNIESEVYNNSKIIFICVKPDIVEPLLKRNINLINENTLLVSIAAGISLEYMENIFINEKEKNPKPKIIRIMSNHLCSINESSSVYCVNDKCSNEDGEIINLLLSKVGIIKKVEEKTLNVFTALAGSGPAFVYLFIDSLIEAGILNGIDYNTARDFAVQTTYASAKYLKDKDIKYPSNMKYVVTTPNGTTIAGLEKLEKNKFKYAIMEAISAASIRGKQIELEKMKLINKSKF